MRRSLLASSKGGAKPNVRVRIRAGIVQIHSSEAGIGTVVPIAATDRESLDVVAHD